MIIYFIDNDFDVLIESSRSEANDGYYQLYVKKIDFKKDHKINILFKIINR